MKKIATLLMVMLGLSLISYFLWNYNLNKGLEFVKKGNYENAIQNFRMACKYKNKNGCIELGKAYFYMGDNEENITKIKSFFELASIYNNTLAYTGLGDIYFKEKNYNKSLEYYTKACNANNAKGCVAVGAIYLNGIGVEIDETKATKFYNQACQLGDNMGCTALANRYYNGDGVRIDYNKSSKLFTKACDNNNIVACEKLGNMYNQGEGVKQDIFEAIRLYKIACNNNFYSSCTTLGAIYFQGKDNLSKNYQLSEKYFSKSCSEDIGLACFGLGGLYVSMMNFSKAGIFYQKACDLKVENACQLKNYTDTLSRMSNYLYP